MVGCCLEGRDGLEHKMLLKVSIELLEIVLDVALVCSTEVAIGGRS
jgi:hypothetical protein